MTVDQVDSLESGVYLVKLFRVGSEGMEAYHVVCVDANAQLVFDSVEPFAMPLQKSGLVACVGDKLALKRYQGDHLMMRILEIDEKKREKKVRRSVEAAARCNLKKRGGWTLRELITPSQVL